LQASKRTVLLSILILLIVAAAAPFGLAPPVFVLSNLVLGFFFLMDRLRSKPDFEISRVGGEKLSLFADEEIVFEVYNRMNRQLRVDLRDEVPDFHFEVRTPVCRAIIQPHEKVRMAYGIIPRKRGIYEFPAVHARFESRLGLSLVHVRQELPGKYKVYPNLKDLRKYRLMVFGGYLSATGKRIWNQRGSGMEFESLRHYVSGDSFRKINWNATARSPVPIVNQYEVEKNQDVIAILDAGRPMSYEVRGCKKLDLAVNTALILSDIANLTGDKSGLLVFNTEIGTWIGPGKGPEHRLKLMEGLFDVDYTRETSNWQVLFGHVGRVLKKRSILFVFTEFETADEADDLLKCLPFLHGRHLVMVFTMVPENLEALGRSVPKDDSEIFLKTAALEMLEERKLILSRIRKTGVMCVECLPDELGTDVINRYIALKRKNAAM